jgi:uncharacterized membrane protein YfcA
LDYLLVIAVSLLVSGLTLISGFGLGTLLTPVFAIFFPLPLAIAATAVVHLASHLFNVGLVGKWAHWPTVLKFSIAAVIAAIVGARLLGAVAHAQPLITYHLSEGRRHEITLLKLLIGAILAGFALMDLAPRKQKSLGSLPIPLGGALSGFFAGVSGIQGALRSAFLVRAGLGREAYVGTSAVCAVAVDLARIPLYFKELGSIPLHAIGLVIAACLAAFAGSVGGARVMKKVTFRTIQRIVAAMLLILAACLAIGIV